MVLPTYKEAENIAEVLGLVRERRPGGRGARRRRRQPRRHRRPGRGRGRASSAQSTCCGATEKSGLGSAYRAGFGWGLERGFEVLVEMDADLQHDPAMLPALIQAVEDGADLAIGSRYVPGGSVPGLAVATGGCCPSGATATPALVLGMPVRDATAGFRAYRADRSREDRPRRGPGRRLRLPDRDGLRRSTRRAATSSRCRSRSATARGARRRCRSTSSSRPCGS